MRRRNVGRTAEEVFAEVYEKGLWGSRNAAVPGSQELFHSGSGSRGAVSARYVATIRGFLGETGARTVVDVGCGDFSVASGFVDQLDEYVGIDVVDSLIRRNSADFGRPGIRFLKANAAREELPKADVCLIRQVLQHLSNDEVSAILRGAAHFRWVIVTEHEPAPRRRTGPNRDKPHGPDTRLDSGSWVDIAAPPFECTPVTELANVPADEPLYSPGEVIRTVVWEPKTDGPGY